MAELLLEDFGPLSLARSPKDVGYDFLVSFRNSRGGTNTFGVEIKATERPDLSSFVVDRQTYNRWAHSTIPGLLLVVDVKQDRLLFGWPQRVDSRHGGYKSVRVPLTEIDDRTKKELHKRLVAW